MSGSEAFRGLLFSKSFLKRSSLTVMSSMSGKGSPSGTLDGRSWVFVRENGLVLSVYDICFIF